MKGILLIALTFFSITNCFCQKRDTEYYFISNDTSLVGHYLSFKNDSIVQISNVPRHMWQPMIKDLKYENLNGKLIIYIGDSLRLDKYGFIDDKELMINGKALVNESREEIYVIRKDYDKYPDVVVRFAGKEYKIDGGESDSYGLLKKLPNRNRKLQRKLKTVDLNEYELNLVKGYEAFKKYGYDYVFGVIELNKK